MGETIPKRKRQGRKSSVAATNVPPDHPGSVGDLENRLGHQVGEEEHASRHRHDGHERREPRSSIGDSPSNRITHCQSGERHRDQCAPDV